MLSIVRGASPEILEKSIIVAAHPDDEVLWFSSILEKVNEVVVCFLDYESNPRWGVGRRKSLAEYPIKNISSLSIEGSEVFNGGNWRNPVITIYGMEITNKSVTDRNEKYEKNYDELKRHLENKLTDCRNVFTHNPWGEYGNEEHIQVYRVVKDLQEKLKYNIRFSNYVSNKSFRLMLDYVGRFNFEYITFETNKILANDIKNVYKRYKCWTWYDDWEWFKEESFIKERVFEEGTEKLGHLFPLNLIKVYLPLEPTRRSPFHYSVINQRAKQRMKKLIRKILRVYPQII